MLLALLKSFQNYTRIMLISLSYAPRIKIMLLVFLKQNKADRTGRIKTKQGITPFGNALFYFSKHSGLILY